MSKVVIHDHETGEPVVIAQGFFEKVKEEVSKKGAPVVEWIWHSKNTQGTVTAKGSNYGNLNDAFKDFLNHHGENNWEAGELTPEGFSPFVQQEKKGNTFRVDVYEKKDA